MNPIESRVAQLVQELGRDWGEVERHRDRALSVDPSTGEPEAALVALSLDRAYQAMETLLLRLERALALPERTGSGWHASLLTDAGSALPGVRPAVVPAEAGGEWEALLGFRHFLRHAYAVPLDPGRLRTNAERLDRAVTTTGPAVAALLEALTGSDPDT